MSIVALSWPELRHASYAGVDRWTRARSAGRSRIVPGTDDDLDEDIRGTWGECVIAKAMGRYWAGDLGAPDGGSPDVGDWHVRTTKFRNGCLILRDNDDDDEPFVLVVVERLPRFLIAGWCYGYEGKKPVYWDTTHGLPYSYWVPQASLHAWNGDAP